MMKFSFLSRRKYADTIPRPFGVRYNAYTQSIEVLDSKPQIDNLCNNINLEVCNFEREIGKVDEFLSFQMHILQNALKKL